MVGLVSLVSFLPGMTAEKEPSTMYKSKSAGAPSDSQAREK